MQVIAIDPAPKKDSTVFDGAAFLEMDAPQLRRFLQAPEHQIPETLVCWDAPRAIFCFHRLNGSMALVVILLNPI